MSCYLYYVVALSFFSSFFVYFSSVLYLFLSGFTSVVLSLSLGMSFFICLLLSYSCLFLSCFRYFVLQFFIYLFPLYLYLFSFCLYVCMFLVLCVFLSVGISFVICLCLPFFIE